MDNHTFANRVQKYTLLGNKIPCIGNFLEQLWFFNNLALFGRLSGFTLQAEEIAPSIEIAL